MQVKKVLFLNMDDARNLTKNVAIPSDDKFTKDDQIVNFIADENLAESLAAQFMNVTQVLILNHSKDYATVVWDIDNLDPNEKKLFLYKQFIEGNPC